jgi:hypothetical protein
MNSSSLQYETINLGTHDQPQNINLGKGVHNKKNQHLLNFSKNLKMYSFGLTMI